MQDISKTAVPDEKSDNQPAFRVYSVIPREGTDDYWPNLSLAFPHGDGKGFNVIRQVLPLSGELVLHETGAEEKAEADRGRNARLERNAPSETRVRR